MALLLSYVNISIYIDRYLKRYRAYMTTFLSFSHIFAFVGLLLLLSHQKAWRIFFEVRLIEGTSRVDILVGLQHAVSGQQESSVPFVYALYARK